MLPNFWGYLELAGHLGKRCNSPFCPAPRLWGRPHPLDLGTLPCPRGPLGESWGTLTSGAALFWGPLGHGALRGGYGLLGPPLWILGQPWGHWVGAAGGLPPPSVAPPPGQLRPAPPSHGQSWQSWTPAESPPPARGPLGSAGQMKAQGQAVAETGATRAQGPIPVPSPSWFPRDGSRGSGGRADQARVGPALTPAGRGGAAREPSPASLVIPSACPPFPSGTLSTLRAPAGGRQVGWAVGVPGKAVLLADTSLPLPLTAGGALAVPPGGTPSAGSLQVLAVNRPVCSPAWGWDPTSPGCSPSPPARALRRPRPVGGLPEAAQPGGSQVQGWGRGHRAQPS